jgi:uncharacterized protein (DUF2147 family)
MSSLEMTQPRNKERSAKPPASAAIRRRPYRLAALVITVAVVAAVGFWWSKSRLAGAPPAKPANQHGSAATPKPAFEKLTGRWQRADGGYIIEIRSIEPGGRMTAAYFNPRPIHVAKAEASQYEGTVNVFIELRDVNYPGSTYSLTYDPADDCLKGIYFQAATGQTFDVYFMRLQP